MNGPIALTHPGATVLELLVDGKEPLDLANLPEYIDLAKKTQSIRLQRIEEDEAAFACERLLTATKDTITESLTHGTAEWQKEFITSSDEVIDNPACDSRALSEHLRPMECHLKFLNDTKDRIDIRIAGARITRLTATLARCQVEHYESQLLCAISILTIEAALAPVRESQGPMLAFSVRTQQLQAAVAEKKRQVGLAEASLRDEVTRQRIIAEQAMATGTITRAQLADASL